MTINLNGKYNIINISRAHMVVYHQAAWTEKYPGEFLERSDAYSEVLSNLMNALIQQV